MKLTIYVKSVLQILLIAAIGWLIYTVRGVLIYIAVASIMALILKPVVNLVCNKKIKGKTLPRALVAALVVALILTSFAMITTFVFPALISEFAVLSKIDFGAAYQTLLENIAFIEKIAPTFDIDVAAIEDSIRKGLTSFLNLETIENTIGSILGGLGNIAIAVFSIIFILFFFLKEANLSHFLTHNFLSAENAEHMDNILPKIKRTLYRYSLGLLAQMTVIFFIVYIGLSLVGVESSLVIAVFAAFINLIPYLGPLIGFIFGITLGLGQAVALFPDSNFGLLALKIAAVFAVAQLTDNFVSQPIIFSNSINAHPLEIFIIISIAGLLGGVIGMIIAVPTYSMIRIASKEFFKDSKFIQSFTKNV